MGGVQKRVVHYEFDRSKGIFRLHDWNTVTTSLGVMMEPSQIVPRPEEGRQLDWEDRGTQIDELKNMNADKPMQIYTGGDSSTHLIGYNLQPRKGR